MNGGVTKFEPRRVPVHEYDVDPVRLLEGNPKASSTVLWGSSSDRVQGGIWELTEGILDDVEADELVYVVHGRATLFFPDTGESLELTEGDVAVLSPGRKSQWRVHERLRMVFAART